MRDNSVLTLVASEHCLSSVVLSHGWEKTGDHNKQQTSMLLLKRANNAKSSYFSTYLACYSALNHTEIRCKIVILWLMHSGHIFGENELVMNTFVVNFWYVRANEL